MRQRRKLHAYGRAEDYRVDKTEAANHVRALRELDWSVEAIATAAGVRRSVIDSLLSKRYDRTTRETAEAVLRIPIRLAPTLLWNRIPATGTVRRIQALAYVGWSIQALSRIGGFGDRYLHGLTPDDLVYERTAERMSALYDQLWDKQPPQTNRYEKGVVTRTRALARERGWVGPLHWDDIDTDPEPATTENPRTGRELGWVIDELEHFRLAGESPHVALGALRRDPGATVKLAYRHGRPDLGRWLEEAA